MITKRMLVLKLLEEKRDNDEKQEAFHAIYRVSRVLGISTGQVLRYLLTEDKWQTKPRKPKVKR